ncbi:MAG: nucleotidyltransferase domain-containing protein [Paludibacter sp.]
MATNDVLELLRKYVTLLNTEGISVYKAYLFGSYSTNTATEFSDIDVMIVSTSLEEPDDKVTGKAWKLTRKIDSKIEPFLIGLNKFNDDSSSPILSMIKSKGILIS